MKKYFSVLIFAATFMIACENKSNTTDTASAGDSDTTTAGSVDTTTMYEKQHYGNGNTETSGNSGH